MTYTHPNTIFLNFLLKSRNSAESLFRAIWLSVITKFIESHVDSV